MRNWSVERGARELEERIARMVQVLESALSSCSSVNMKLKYEAA